MTRAHLNIQTLVTYIDLVCTISTPTPAREQRGFEETGRGIHWTMALDPSSLWTWRGILISFGIGFLLVILAMLWLCGTDSGQPDYWIAIFIGLTGLSSCLLLPLKAVVWIFTSVVSVMGRFFSRSAQFISNLFDRIPPNLPPLSSPKPPLSRPKLHISWHFMALPIVFLLFILCIGFIASRPHQTIQSKKIIDLLHSARYIHLNSNLSINQGEVVITNLDSYPWHDVIVCLNPGTNLDKESDVDPDLIDLGFFARFSQLDPQEVCKIHSSNFADKTGKRFNPLEYSVNNIMIIALTSEGVRWIFEDMYIVKETPTPSLQSLNY